MVGASLEFYAFAIPAVLLYAMGKGGLGGGLGMVAVPLMALSMEPMQAAAILLPILCVMDVFAVRKFRDHFSRLHLKRFLPGTLIGIALASLLLFNMSGDTTRLITGGIAVAFSLNHWLGLGIASKPPPGKVAGFVWGVVAGITSTQIHAGGPPASAYLLPQKMDKLELMGTMAIAFAVINAVKLVPYMLTGAIDTSNIWLSISLMPLAPVGVWIGYRLLQVIDQRLLYRLLYLFLFASGIKLIADGLV